MYIQCHKSVERVCILGFIILFDNNISFFILIWVNNQVDGDCALKVVPRRVCH